MAAIVAASVTLIPATASVADDRVVNGALGAGAGALVAGPVGLVAGAAIGVFAGKDISRGLGLEPRRARKHRREHRYYNRRNGRRQ
jgi:outer membrane lipoprotein SlyB